jgi:hypothetical protein
VQKLHPLTVSRLLASPGAILALGSAGRTILTAELAGKREWSFGAP